MVISTPSQALPRGYSVRGPRLDDAGAIADLVNASARAEIGMQVTTADRMLAILSDPTRDVDDKGWLVFHASGSLAASLDLYGYPPYTMFEFDGHVHPAHTGRGIGAFLLDTAEISARREMHRAAEGARVALGTRVWGESVATHRLLESRGFDHIRDWRRMEIDLATITSEPVPAAGITIRVMRRGRDERAIHETIEAAFADHWGYAPTPYDEFVYYELDGAPEFDPTLVFLAMDGEEVAGAVICRGSRAGDESIGWISSLGTRREWRGRGIGQALLLHAFGELRRRGRRAAGLSVDASSPTGADRLYERVGMREVRRDVIYEKVLRPAAG